jgi:putative ABC transport system ATP-binding protein
VLIVTHSAEAVRIADRVITLEDGQARETREASDVRH